MLPLPFISARGASIVAASRLRAGVTSNLEVIQAQEAVASAVENHIGGLYAQNLAKASLARAMGIAGVMAKGIREESR